MAPTLLFSAMLAMAGTILYGYVGDRLAKREVSVDAEPALQLFATWWFALAGSQLVTGASELLAAAGMYHVGIHAGLSYVNLFLVVVGIYALLYYLIYVFKGEMPFFNTATLAYLGYYLVVLYLITMSNQIALDIGAWSVTLVSAEPLSGPVVNAIVGALLVPPLVAVAGYLRLYRYVETRTQRYRVLVIGISIALWFGSTLLVHLAGVETATVWPLISKLVGLAAAIAVLVAYFPPSWIQRYGIEPLGATSYDRPAEPAPDRGIDHGV